MTKLLAVFVGLQEWRELGAELAELDAGTFLKLLDAARARVQSARASRTAERPFFGDDEGG